jgi:hypothetical protein
VARLLSSGAARARARSGAPTPGTRTGSQVALPVNPMTRAQLGQAIPSWPPGWRMVPMQRLIELPQSVDIGRPTVVCAAKAILARRGP